MFRNVRVKPCDKITFTRNGSQQLATVNVVRGDTIIVSYFNEDGRAKGRSINSSMIINHEPAGFKFISKFLIFSVE